MMTDTQQLISPFHLAFPVQDLPATRDFYTRVLGCSEGRSSDSWIDFDFFGHQLVAHCVKCSGERRNATGDAGENPVDGRQVPVPHFGVVLAWDEWQTFAKRITESGMEFVIEPYIRFQGEVGEQATMFFRDPSGNALEFKAFRNPDQLFAS